MIKRRRGIQRSKKQDRYGVKAVKRAGESYRSKFENTVHGLLKRQEEDGEITILGREVQVYLHEARFIYTPDFHCLDIKTNEEFFAEAKGVETDTWRRNYRLWKFHGPAPLRIYKGNHGYPKLVETVIPLDACKNCGRPMKGAS